MNKEQILKNTLKGTFYENFEIKDYKIEKTMLDELPGKDVSVEMIKKGEIVFLLDGNTYKIDVDDGYFKLFVKEGSNYFEAGGWYISTRVKLVNNEYCPLDTPASYDDRTKMKKSNTVYMSDKS